MGTEYQYSDGDIKMITHKMLISDMPVKHIHSEEPRERTQRCAPNSSSGFNHFL